MSSACVRSTPLGARAFAGSRFPTAASSGGSNCRRAATRSTGASLSTAASCCGCAGSHDRARSMIDEPNRNAPIAADAPRPQASDGPMAGMPADAIIVIPTRNLVLFPGLIAPLMLGRASSIAGAQEAARTGRKIGVLLQRNSDAEDPKPSDLYAVGTVATILRYLTLPDGTHSLVCHGDQRFRVAGFVDDVPFAVARVELLSDPQEMSKEIEARMMQVKARAAEALELMQRVPAELVTALEQVSSPGALADFVAGLLDIKPAEKQDILETYDIAARLDMVLRFLVSRIEVLRLSREIGEQTQERLEQRQREILLREQMKTIQKELGEADGADSELAELAEQIAKAQMPDEVEKQAKKELKRLEQMSEASPEYSMVRTYLSWLVELPWATPSDERIEIDEARRILNADHYGLDKVKRRILEFLAVRKAGTRNCVMMLDEMDKLGAGIQGDPASALLEVLDPEQNSTFRDNYLGVPFDLSRILFIGTANVLDRIPGPLRDRMEVVELPGYTEQEKLQIAQRYLVRRQLEATGLTPEQCEVSDDALRAVIGDYTREAGVRNLEREIGSLFRHAAMRIAEGTATHVRIDAADVAAILGPPRFESELAMRTSVPGVSTGLAWTPVGGDILFIEATRTPGTGRLILTGQLGEVMKESAQAALTLVKARAVRLQTDPSVFEKSDVHLHVPAGAIPKDGPSAGVAMFVALTSLALDKPVRSDCAMTGEISLRGLVLPVGGIKEKVLAALRAGIHTVLLPARNRKDLEEIPEDARKRLTFVWLETVDDALRNAIGYEPAPAFAP